jgi:hypothetical protein
MGYICKSDFKVTEVLNKYLKLKNPIVLMMKCSVLLSLYPPM